MNQNKQSRLIALIVTLLVHGLLALLLWLIHFSSMHFEDEGGILVMVGVDADAGGDELMASDITDLPTDFQPEDQLPDAASPEPTPSPEATEPLLAQDDAETPYVADNDQKLKEEQEREAKLRDEAERKRQEEIRRQQEEEAKRRAAEEAKRKAEEERKRQEAARIANQLGGLFNSHGDGSAAGIQGQPDGNSTEGAASGSPGYGSYDLGGRGISGSLPRPSFNSNISGKIVVYISVNAQGNVTAASIGKGTDISDPSLRNAAIEAAKRAKFKAISGTSTTPGTITYFFDSNN